MITNPLRPASSIHVKLRLTDESVSPPSHLRLHDTEMQALAQQVRNPPHNRGHPLTILDGIFLLQRFINLKSGDNRGPDEYDLTTDSSPMRFRSPVCQVYLQNPAADGVWALSYVPKNRSLMRKYTNLSYQCDSEDSYTAPHASVGENSNYVGLSYQYRSHVIGKCNYLCFAHALRVC